MTTRPEIDEEARLLLLEQYQARWQRGLTEGMVRYGRLERVPGPEDPETVDRSWLPRLAVGRAALTYTDILGEEYERHSVASADFYHTWAGYPLSVRQFAEDVDIVLSWEFVRSGMPERVTGVDFFLSSAAHIAIDPQPFLDFVEEALRKLIPFFAGQTINLHISTDFCFTLALAASVTQLDVQVTGA